MDRHERVAEILGEWQDRRDRGEAVTPEEVVAAHPDLAPELKSQFAFLGAIEGAPGAEAPGTPKEIGDFRIVREIGRGGMGVVYEAEQTSMRRRVALKVLSLAVAGAPHAVRRFEREARAAGKLHHTNIVPIYAMGAHAGHWYYAMELVKGMPLSKVVAQLRAAGSHPTEESLARMTPAAASTGTSMIASSSENMPVRNSSSARCASRAGTACASQKRARTSASRTSSCGRSSAIAAIVMNEAHFRTWRWPSMTSA